MYIILIYIMFKVLFLNFTKDKKKKNFGSFECRQH